MIDILAELLRQEIDDLNFAEKTAGLVKAYRYTDTFQDNSRDVTIPIAYDVNPSTCNPQDLTDLVPDNSKKSIMYFEDLGTNVIQTTRRYNRYQSNLRLICWVNLKLINENYTNSNQLLGKVMSVIPATIDNQDYIAAIKCKISGFATRDELFTQYTYNETQTQFMTFPYDAFGINLEILYNIPTSCVTDVTLSPDACY